MEAVTSNIVISETLPNLRINLCKSTPLNWRVSIAEALFNPFILLGSILTCQKFGEKYVFQSVMGAISLIGSFPTQSELMTTAGRTFLISAPTVGSKLTNQISPRFGISGLIVNDVTCH